MSQVPPPMGTPPMGYQTPAQQKSQGLAIGALVCGILSIVLFCMWFVSIPLGIVAIVLGVIGKGKAARGEAGGEGLAKTGMILGIVGTLIAVIWLIAIFTGASFIGKKAEELQRKAEEMQQQQQVEGTTTTTEPASP